jgi:hypothetical protein
MFDLPPFYTKSIVESKELKLKQNILNNSTINEETKEKTIHFLIKAKNCILDQLPFDNNTVENNEYKSYYKLEPIELDKNSFENPIQQKSETSYVSSYPSEYYAGIINPIKKRFIKKNLIIDTKFRDNYYNTQSTNFHFDLPIKFSDVMQVQLSAFEMPFTYYNISKQMGNNFFSITLESAPASHVIVTIPDGNYTPAGLVSYLNNFVVGTTISGIQFIYNIDASGNGSGQLIIGTTGAGVGNFTLTFNSDIYGNLDTINPLPLKLGWLLGFRNGSYSGNNNYVGEGLVDLAGQKYLYLVVDDYNNNVNNSFYSAFNSSILNKNILARISFQSNPFGSVSQNNLSLITTPRQYFGPVDIQKLKIQLLDEYGRVIEMNNMDYSFCLTFTSVYDI